MILSNELEKMCGARFRMFGKILGYNEKKL